MSTERVPPTERSEPDPAADARDADGRELVRLIEVMQTLRTRCPWDAEQTHRSLVQYLIEETCEVVEAIEGGAAAAGEVSDGIASGAPGDGVIDHDHLREELGDLLLQVIFHSTIAAETDPSFSVAAVARSVADKLISRHPYVYATADVPEDLMGSWEERKAQEKGRTSVLEGIPQQLSALARASKIISRARSRSVPLPLPADPIDAETLGDTMIELVARAQAGGIDAEQAARDAVRRLESRVVDAEA